MQEQEDLAAEAAIMCMCAFVLIYGDRTNTSTNGAYTTCRTVYIHMYLCVCMYIHTYARCIYPCTDVFAMPLPG